MLKAYLSIQPFSLSAFKINKTHRVAQRPRGRCLNVNVCSTKSAIFVLCSTMVSRKQFKHSLPFQYKTDAYHSAELYNYSASS